MKSKYVKIMKIYCNVCHNYKNLKTLKSHILLKTHLLFIQFGLSVVMNIKYIQRRLNWNIKNSWFNYKYRRVWENI